MKKTCFVLLCALLLGLAPSTFAADDAALGPFDALLAQLVALFSGSAAPAEMGWEIIPGGRRRTGQLHFAAEQLSDRARAGDGLAIPAWRLSHQPRLCSGATPAAMTRTASSAAHKRGRSGQSR